MIKNKQTDAGEGLEDISEIVIGTGEDTFSMND